MTTKHQNRLPPATESRPTATLTRSRPLAQPSSGLGSAKTGQIPSAASPAPEVSALPPTFPERLLTAKEISSRLFIKPRTAALWARQGRLPAYRIGRRLGFKWEEVEQALPKTKAESGNL